MSLENKHGRETLVDVPDLPTTEKPRVLVRCSVVLRVLNTLGVEGLFRKCCPRFLLALPLLHKRLALLLLLGIVELLLLLKEELSILRLAHPRHLDLVTRVFARLDERIKLSGVRCGRTDDVVNNSLLQTLDEGSVGIREEIRNAALDLSARELQD